MKRFLIYFSVAILGGVSALGGYKYFEKPQTVSFLEGQSQPAAIIRTANSSIGAEAADFTVAAERSVNAVVHVKTIYQAETYYNPFGRFFGQPYYQAEPARGSGSGVILSPDGYIVTNNHVIDNAEIVEVTLNDYSTYQAKVIGTDPGTDLALLKVEGESLPSIPLGNSDDVKIGEWVLAVGNPFNLTSTVTAGIVSAKARNINILEYNPDKDIFPIESFIQTDAAVNPGNSGGALVNVRGELIGINTAIASRTGSYSGYSFAIPVSIVRKVTNDLLEYGVVQRAYIGVNISNISQELAAEKNLSNLRGAYIRGLMEGGAASEAGLKEGDIIVKVQGIPVQNVTQLQEQVGKYRPGDKVDVTILRNNSEKTFNVVLKNREGGTEISKIPEISSADFYGASLSPVERDELERLKIPHGVKVSTLKSGKLAESGIKQGFIITKIDNRPVRNPSDVSEILSNKKGGILIEGVYPNGITAYYGFGI